MALTAVGFEPTQLVLVELESTPLDHSGKLSMPQSGPGARIGSRGGWPPAAVVPWAPHQVGPTDMQPRAPCAAASILVNWGPSRQQHPIGGTAVRMHALWQTIALALQQVQVVVNP